MPSIANKETGHRLQLDFENTWGSEGVFLITMSAPDVAPVQCEFRAFEIENLLRRLLAERWRSLPEMEWTANNPISVADVVDGVTLRTHAGDQVVAITHLTDKQRRELIKLLGGTPPAPVRQGEQPPSAST